MIRKRIRKILFRLQSAEKWSAARGYSDLHCLLGEHGLPASSAEFASGPLRRFFDLALAPDQSAGQRCRILEHARLWERRARDQFSDPAAAAALAAGIQAEVDRVEALGPGGRWVLEVFRGNHTHHAAPAFPDAPFSLL